MTTMFSNHVEVITLLKLWLRIVLSTSNENLTIIWNNKRWNPLRYNTFRPFVNFYPLFLDILTEIWSQETRPRQRKSGASHPGGCWAPGPHEAPLANRPHPNAFRQHKVSLRDLTVALCKVIKVSQQENFTSTRKFQQEMVRTTSLVSGGIHFQRSPTFSSLVWVYFLSAP